MSRYEPALQPLEAIYQHPADLELGVLTGELPVALTILAQKSVTVGTFYFQFHIIGESHYVRVEHGGALVLQEVLACMTLPPAACRHHHRFGDMAAHNYQHEGYSVTVNFDALPPVPLPANKSPDLELQFPPIHGQIPVTRIHLEQANQILRWWTLHLYPQPQGLVTVRTFSQFCL